MNTAKSDSSTLRWGIIGCGNVTEQKSGPAYQICEGFQLRAVMRRDPIKLEDYARRHQIQKFTTDADALIQDPEIDAVYIATPPDSHLFYGLKVAAAGKICCVEKPMTNSYADSLILQKAFSEKNLPLFVAYYRRSLPRFKQIKSWIAEGAIGKPRHISWHLSKPPNKWDLSGEYNWRTDPKVAPGGYFDDLGSHGLDLFAFLLGDYQNVFGLNINQQKLYKTPDAITACWTHKNGTTGTGFWNFGTDKRVDQVEIFGSKGQIKFSVFHENPVELINEETKQVLVIEHPEHVQLPFVEDMAKALLGSKGFFHPSTAEKAIQSNWVMDKILGA